jgi:hypothetical protein
MKFLLLNIGDFRETLIDFQQRLLENTLSLPALHFSAQMALFHATIQRSHDNGNSFPSMQNVRNSKVIEWQDNMV